MMRDKTELMGWVRKIYDTYETVATVPALLSIVIEILLDIRELLKERVDTLNSHGV